MAKEPLTCLGWLDGHGQLVSVDDMTTASCHGTWQPILCKFLVNKKLGSVQATLKVVQSRPYSQLESLQTTKDPSEEGQLPNNNISLPAASSIHTIPDNLSSGGSLKVGIRK